MRLTDRSSDRSRSGLVWPLLAVAVATAPVAGVFTTSRLFYVRDLTLAFRSRFLFLRHSIQAGSFPLWDPYPANGQSSASDALYQLFHLPSLLIRLLLPEVVAFNAWVALPIPLAAAGMYLFLRRHVRAPAAAFGGAVFAVAGPIVSTANFPNLSWCVAAVPYVFWALERLLAAPSGSRATLLAAIVACQALAGEPVTLTATLALAAVYAAIECHRRRQWRDAAFAAVGIGAGGLLAAIQYLPLAAASRQSLRQYNVTSDFWAFHPLALVELLVPHFFGDYFHSHLRELGWMLALNSGRDPFYYTMYVGVPVVVLALAAAFSRRPHTLFWTVSLLVLALASVGPHTLFYPVLQFLLPPLKTFRFPVKYLSLGAFGLATLAASALQWLLDDDVPSRAARRAVVVAGILAVITYVVVGWVLIAPRLPIVAFYHLASWARVPAPEQGAEFLLYRARPLLASLFLKLACAAFLLWVASSRRPERRLATVVLAAFAVIDLAASNSSVNPVADASLVGTPEWVSHVPADMHERIYIGGHLGGYVDTLDIDAPKYAITDDELSQIEQRSAVVAQLVFHPSGVRLREAVSYDLPLLWPVDYARAITRFKEADRETRLRFLDRTGTRFLLLTPPAPKGIPAIAGLPAFDQIHLYDANPAARRAYVVPDALMGPDVKWQIEGLFQPRFNPKAGVLVSEPPPPAAGLPGAAVPASATFLEDGNNRVVVRAGLPDDGYLALLDTYDPDWHVDVDGAPAALMRANGIFRAVHLRRGEHVVTFTYRPKAFYLGAGVSLVTAFALAAWCVTERRRRRLDVAV